MDFTIDKQEHYAVVKLLAEKLDTHVAPNLKSQLVVLNSEGVKNIIVDLEQTRYCDSSGLSAILVANRLCKGAEGAFVITGVQEAVMKLISISQLDTILNIIPTVKESIDFVMMDQIENDLNNEG